MTFVRLLVAGPFIGLVVAGCQGTPLARDDACPHVAVAAVRFSPDGGCTDTIIHEITQAKSQILVLAYAFTSQPIAEALATAHRRGVAVMVVADKSQRSSSSSVLPILRDTGIPVSIDAAHAIQHNKVMIIDDETVVTGSFNFTAGAENRNAENLVVLRDHRLADRYRDEWRRHMAHAAPMPRRNEPTTR